MTPRHGSPPEALTASIGAYDVRDRIGRGASGTVYRARHRESGRDVAIKVLHHGDAADDEARERFRREASAAQTLTHRHCVRVLDAGEDDGNPYIVMELLQGRTLREHLRENAALDVETKVDIVAQLCLGLHQAHQHGLVHRDVKPANIFLTDDGVVKVLDFGVAKIGESTVTADGSLVGTVSYMSPEQLSTRDGIDGRADVFSAGVVLYELLCGKRPFEAESAAVVLTRILHDQPPPLPSLGMPELERVAMKALSKDPSARFATAHEFACALWTAILAPRAAMGAAAEPMSETLYAELPPQHDRDTLASPPPKNRQTLRPRGPLLALAAATAVLLAAVAGTVAWNRESVAATQPPEAPTPIATPPPTAAIAPPVIERRLTVESTPAGADVLLNDKKLGQTPLTLTPEIGQQIRLERAGHTPATFRIAQEHLVDGRIAATLSPLPRVRFRASGPYAFEIVAAGRVISASATSHDISITAGQHVRLTSRRYLLGQTVNVDRTPRVEIAEPGKLAIRSIYVTCTVYVDGQDQGNPAVPPFDIAAGAHDVELRCPDGRVKRSQVTVPPGRLQTHRIE